MEEEDVLCRFGTPLEPLEEDEIPSKKPITIEDQIVTDSNGRRRFHGAFTGGFSAGFWNTVGSLEGWKPQNFKSSRYEKAEKLAQTPTDFMDDEDLGEFGIAPQRIQTTDDFTPQESSTKDRKRKLQQPSGPIPGIPVLHQLLQPAREIVAIRLLKRMGWKAGQGIGARQTRREKKVAKERNARERYVMKKYGCDLGPLQGEKQPSKTSDGSSSDESDISDEEITFAPDDFDPYVCSIKDNSFGLGYSGLDRNPVLKKQQHIDLFGPFEVMGKGNKKLSIRGQAFGVGALEEEDEDIYAKDDMTKYDFSLDDSKNKQKKKQKMEDDKTIIDGFHAAKVDATKRKKVFRVHIPAGFKPRNWSVRKTRFEPLDEIKTALLKKKDEHKTKGLGRHDLNPDERGSILGENAGTSKPVVDDKKPSGKFDKKTYIQKVNEKYQSKEKEKDILEIIGSRIDNFTQGGIVNTSLEPPPSSVEVEVDESVKKENDKIQQDALNITKCLDKKPTIFKPFINNEPKQERYDKFLEADLSDDAEIDKFLASIQPLSMTDWDREMEKKEFLQARRIYKPLKGLMSERFVTESTATAERITTQKASTTDKKIEIIRTKTMWKPCAQLCKRFNVAEPFGGTMIDQKVTKRARFSVFDYLEVSVNKKDDFVTPVIIPTKSEKPKPIIHQDMTSKKRNDNSKLETEPTSSRISAKDIFTKASSSGDSAKSGEDSKDLPIKFNPTKKSDTDDLISKDKEVSHQHKTPKSALEKKIEESRTKHPSEKKDLFKLIFESSSEDEEDDSEATKEKMDEKSTANPQISKNVLHSLTKTAAEINILRNTSPPRGLFAFLLDKKPESSGAAKDSNTAGVSPENKTSTNSADKDLKKQDLTTRKSPEIEGIYGPMPPAMVPSIHIPSSQTIDVEDTPTSTEASEVDTKILKLLKKTKSKKIVEEWVEKPTSNKEKKKKKDKDKKRKKHKKDKKKHKDKK